MILIGAGSDEVIYDHNIFDGAFNKEICIDLIFGNPVVLYKPLIRRLSQLPVFQFVL